MEIAWRVRGRSGVLTVLTIALVGRNAPPPGAFVQYGGSRTVL